MEKDEKDDQRCGAASVQGRTMVKYARTSCLKGCRKISEIMSR